MESSTHSSIHTLPENHVNDIVGKLNGINDINDEIATYARGLDNLTEELQKTTLDDIGNQRASVEPMQSHETNGFSTETAFDSNGSSRTNGVDLINGEHNYAVNGNDLNGDSDDGVCNGNCDVVDSSPNSTIVSDYVDKSSNSILGSMPASELYCSMATNCNGTPDVALSHSPVLRSNFFVCSFGQI